MKKNKEKLNIPVLGMHCAACSGRVERIAGNMPGVEKAVVNLLTEELSLEFNPQELKLASLSEAIKKAGFTLILDNLESQNISHNFLHKAQDNTLDFSINGMHCAACSSRIERVLATVTGIKNASVNLAAESAHVTLHPGYAPDKMRTDIERHISELGFGATLLQQTSSNLSNRWELREKNQNTELETRKAKLSCLLPLAGILLLVSMGEMLGLPLPNLLNPHIHPLNFALFQLILCTPVIFIGRSFYQLGIPALFRRVPNMDTLVALGTGAAFLYSLWNTVEIALAKAGILPQILAATRVMDLYYESSAVLIALISLGKYFELRSKARTSDAIKGLLDLAPEQTILLQDGHINSEQLEISVSSVQPGNMLLVRPGERVPVDGVITEGSSSLDEAMLTGESLPIDKSIGDKVTAGTINLHGAFAMKAERVGADTVLARIVSLVETAQGSKAPVATLADRISLYFVPAVIFIAISAGSAWLLSGAGFDFSLRIFVSVMVIACPCAMGLATPTSIMVGTGRGAQLGVLIKSGEALEKAAKIDTLVFDKTGTLTIGRPVITDIWLPEEINAELEAAALSVAASLEAFSEHPLALAITKAAQEKKLKLQNVEEFRAIPGKGVQGIINNLSFILGSAAQAKASLQGTDLINMQQQAEIFSSQGKTPVVLTSAGVLKAIFAIADAPRPESMDIIMKLQSLGLRLIMLTGDNQRTANAVAAKLGIKEILAEVLPDEKASKITALQQTACTVGMVGDGINDAPALALADVGFAVNNGTDIAMEAGDIILMREGLTALLTALKLSRATLRNIYQNLFWAFGYNILCIPVAAGLLHIWGGPTLSPMLGGAAMALSSISVITNALRLRFFKP